uniref:Uncharacterized protein n=1 Tax=Minutocellus polymorphus TaxID=265543 RepID=A0A7S0ATZ8_9STRA
MAATATALHPVAAAPSAASGTFPSFNTADMPSEDSSFLTMLQYLPETIIKELDLDGISRFILHLLTEHIIPAVLFAAAFVALYNLGLVASRVIWPPSAQELHIEAVNLLKKDTAVDDTCTDGSSDKRTEVLKLLRAAMAKDPELEVAYITLASELLYGNDGKDIDQALTVLQDAKKRFPKSDEVDKLLVETGAIKKWGKSHGKMAEAGRFPL